MEGQLENQDLYELRRLGGDDAESLHHFYNHRSAESRRTFRPIGLEADLETCRQICRENTRNGADRYDLVIIRDDEIVGWCFIWGLNGKVRSLGLAVADQHQGRGLARALMEAMIEWARGEKLPTVNLTVVQENESARRLYESFGFRVCGERIGSADGLRYHEMVARLDENAD